MFVSSIYEPLLSGGYANVYFPSKKYLLPTRYCRPLKMVLNSCCLVIAKKVCRVMRIDLALIAFFLAFFGNGIRVVT
jgi:hypothetical protein